MNKYIIELKKALQIAFFKEKDMHDVALDKKKTNYAYYIIATSGVLSIIGQQIFGNGWFKPTLGYSIYHGVFQVISTIAMIYLMSFIAKKLFSGKSKCDEFFRVMGYASVVSFIAIIPSISLIGGFWYLALMFVILKTIHKLTTGGAIGTIIVSIITASIVFMILSPILLMLGFQGFGGGSFYGRGNTKQFEMDFKKAFDFENEDGSVKFDDGKMVINDEDGGAIVDFESGKVEIEGMDGEIINIQLPKFEY